MTKVKPVKGASKDGFRNLKNGSIHKKKHQQKFKNTPTGKVTLIDGSQQKANVKLKHQNGKNHQNSPKSNKRSPKGFNKNHSNSKKSPQTKVKIEEEQDDDDSSENDINEGITINEEVSAPEDEVDDDSSSEDDGAIPDIFGKSLVDTTDDDDGEFEADSDEEIEKPEENKGVKMFKGLNVKKEGKESSDDDDAEEEDDDDDADEDDESSDEDVKPTPELKDLLGASIADESDDEDFEGAEESDDDDDDDDDSDEEVDQSLNTSGATSTTEEEESSDDEDDDDDDDHKATDLTALLGNSLAEDSDDEDFEGNSDDDEDDDDMSDDDTDDDTPSPGKKIKVMKTEDTDEEDDNENNESFDSANKKSEDDDNDEKPPIMSKEEREERDSRTIFIGNVPKDTKISRIKAEFKKFGPIENIRIRGIVPENPKMPLKVAAIKRKFHEKSTSVCVFVTFKSAESMQKALSMNGKKLDGNYLRVDHCNQNRGRDKKRSVFLGNLPFTIEDNDIWEMFKKCGRIESVRIIRDRKTGVGRGFGYVNFESVDGATLALDMNGTTIKNRELRVKVNTPEGKKKQRAEKGKKRQLAEIANAVSPKKLKTETSESAVIAKHNSVNAERRKDKKKQKRSQGEKQRIKSESTSPQGKPVGKFQGEKADAKKKSKIDKAAKKKMQIAAKLLAKPKKPSAN